MDLTTPQGLRDFLILCLDGRRKRTPAKLASVMPSYMVEALREHAPDVAAARDAAHQAQLAADRAQRAYVKKLEVWIRPPSEVEPAAHQDAGPPHNGLLCLPEGVGGWLCRYQLGDGHNIHTPYVEGEYLRPVTALEGR